MAVAHLEQALEVGPKAVDDEHIIVALLAAPHDPGHTLCTRKGLVDARLLLERRRGGRLFERGLDLDRDGLARDVVHAVEDGACETRVSGQGFGERVVGREDGMKGERVTAGLTASTVSDLLFEAVFATERVRASHRAGVLSVVLGDERAGDGRTERVERARDNSASTPKVVGMN